MRLLFTVLPLLLAGACASSNLKGEKPVASVGHITVGQAKVADPLSLDGSLRAFGAIGDPVIREYRRRGLRVLITYSKTANVGQLDGDVRHFEEKLVNGYSVRSAEYVYKFEQPNAPKFGRRAVVFFADFKREPSAPRLLLEAFCESEADCAIVSQLTASVFFTSV